MNLRLRITGLCALVTDQTLGSTDTFTATTSSALALMVGPRGHAAHGGSHASAAHTPVLLVDYANLQPDLTTDPDRMVDDPFGHHWACWDLREATLKLRHPPEGPVALKVGVRNEDEVCVQSEESWRDITSIGELGRAYPDLVLKAESLVDAPPDTIPIIARVVLQGGRLEGVVPPATDWARENHWRFGNGFRRALTEGIEYTAALQGPQATLRLVPYDSTQPVKTIVLREREDGEAPIAISNLSTQLRLGEEMLQHLALYHDLFTTSATLTLPEPEACPLGGAPSTTFPDVCPPVWLRRPESA
jgi:hypothetical protein